MSENEKKVREWISLYGRHGTQTGPLGRAFDALLAEHRAEVAAARDAALEEAAERADGGALYVRGVLMSPSERIRALKSQPARRFLDAERVREVRDELLEVAEEVAATDPENPVGLIRSTVAEFAARLGLDLAAAPAIDVPRATRETATVENGLLPAPKCNVCMQRHSEEAACKAKAKR